MPASRTRAVAAMVAVAVPVVAGVPAAEAATLRATLSGAKEAPTKGDPNGRGKARITLNARSGRVCYRISLRGIGTVTAGHIHVGRAGKAGDVVVPLFAKATKRPRGCAPGRYRSEVRDILEHPGRFYVNVHNARYPNGAARGQLRR
jgi:CHRD domain